MQKYNTTAQETNSALMNQNSKLEYYKKNIRCAHDELDQLWKSSKLSNSCIIIYK